jgi:hypothetical protein
MHRPGMVMSITGNDGEAIQFGNRGERIFAAFGHHRSQQGVDRADVFQSTIALQGFEVMAYVDTFPALVTVALEKITTGFGFTDTARDAHFKIIQIGQLRAIILPMRMGVSRDDGLEEAVENR